MKTIENLTSALEAVKEIGYDYNLARVISDLWKQKANKELKLIQNNLFEAVNPEKHFPDFEGYKKAIIASFETKTGLPYNTIKKLCEYHYWTGSVFISTQKTTDKELVVTFTYNHIRTEFEKLFPRAKSFKNGYTKVTGEELPRAKEFIIMVYLAQRHLERKPMPMPESLREDALKLLESI